MDTPRTCPTCGGTISVAGPAGNCARCLLGGMESLFTSVLNDEPAAPDLPEVPRHVLYEVVGEGGFGVVYRARQTEPVQREVAVKLLKNVAPSREAVARFTAESRALARLQHPGIAAVHDAGSTRDGRLYFSMELVEGRPLTAWAREERPPLPLRLKLFAAVCDAVEHAHQRGIIHRDLKPSNILVDADGAPRVIDFGLAKATEPEAAPQSLLTMDRDLLGTPGYMSPEQARGGSLAVDTRSDVYAIGAVLYELLAGAAPFGDRDSSPVELLRRVCEEIPPPPSRLDRTLPQDLDWVVLRALEKEPARRYQSVAALRDDVLAWLDGKPVTARPPGWAYRARKFTRRHWLPVSIAAALLAAIISGGIFSAVYATRAREESRRADAAALETKRVFSYAELAAAGQLVRDGEPAEAVTRLCRALRTDPDNTTAGAALAGLLMHTSFVTPAAEPADVGARADALHWRGDSLVAVCNDGAVRRLDAGGMKEWHSTRRGYLASHWLESRAWLATGGGDGAIEVWDASTGLRIAGPFKAANPALIRAVRLSPDGGRIFAAAHGGAVHGWAIPEGTVLFSTTEGDARTLALSPDGAVLAGGYADGTIVLRSPETGAIMRSLDCGKSSVTTLGFSPDGRTIAAGLGNGAAQVFDMTSGASLTPPLLHGHSVSTLSFSPCSTRLATGSLDGTARVWCIEDAKPLTLWLRHRDAIYTLAFSPDGLRLATGSRDSTARIWDAHDGRALCAPLRHERSVTALAWDSTGLRLATGGRDGFIRRWDTRPRAALPLEIDLPGTAWAGFDKADGMLLAWTQKRLLHRFDPRTGESLNAPSWIPGDARYRLTTLQNEGFFDALTHREIPRYTAIAGAMLAAGYAAAQSPVFVIEPHTWKLAAALKDGRIQLWQLEPAQKLGEVPAFSDPAPSPLTVLALAPDGAHGAAGYADGKVGIFCVAGAQWGMPPRQEHRGKITSLVFDSTSRKLASGSADNTARLWDLAALQPSPALLHEDVAAPDGLLVRFTGRGSTLLTSGSQDLTLRRWNAAAGTPSARPLYLGDQIAAFRAGASGLLWCGVTGSEGRRSFAQALELNTGEPLTPPLPVRRRTEWTTLDTRDALAAIVDSDGTISLWPMPSREQVPDGFLTFAEESAGVSLPGISRPATVEAHASAPTSHQQLTAWMNSDPGTRTLHPGSKLTAQDARRRALQSKDEPALRAMLHLFPGDPELLRALASVLDRRTGTGPSRAAEAGLLRKLLE